MMRFLGVLVLAFAALALTSTDAFADSFQGFESNTNDWYDGGVYGTVTRVSSGSAGNVASATGGFHAVVDGDENASEQASYTDWASSSSVWPGTWYTSIDIYLDTGWDVGTGFEYVVAVNNSSGSWLRDFVFYVAQDDSESSLLVAASDTSGYTYAASDNLETFDDYAEVSSSGWYTFQTVLYDDGGVLTADMSVHALGSGSALLSATVSGGNAISGVGGPAYGWFMFIDSTNSLAIDNSSLTIGSPVPEPSTLATLGLALACVVGVRRRKSARAAR